MAHHGMGQAQYRQRRQEYPRKQEGIKGGAHLRGRQVYHNDNGKGRDIPAQQVQRDGPQVEGCSVGRHAVPDAGQSSGQQGIGGHRQRHSQKVGQHMAQQQLPPGDRQAVVKIHRPAVVHIAHPGKRQDKAARQPQQAYRPHRYAHIQAAPVGRADILIHPLSLFFPPAEHRQQVRQRNADEPDERQVHHIGDIFLQKPAQQTAKAVRRGCCCNHNPPPPFLR